MFQTIQFPFNQQMLDGAPAENGLYSLYSGNELIYIGRAVGVNTTIQSRLRDHMSGREGMCTKSASTYGFLITNDGERLEKRYLAEHEQQFGSLPRCNSRVG